jgi:hypothetical protein
MEKKKNIEKKQSGVFGIFGGGRTNTPNQK